jgi:hypothetical protein
MTEICSFDFEQPFIDKDGNRFSPKRENIKSTIHLDNFRDELFDLFNEKALLNILFNLHKHFIFFEKYKTKSKYKYYTQNGDMIYDLNNILEVILNCPEMRKHKIKFMICDISMIENIPLLDLPCGTVIYYDAMRR